MAGIEDTPEGGETRRYGNTIGVPHTESDDTRLENAAIEPGSVVGIDSSGNLAKADADAGIELIGVLVNYPVYGASHIRVSELREMSMQLLLFRERMQHRRFLVQ